MSGIIIPPAPTLGQPPAPGRRRPARRPQRTRRPRPARQRARLRHRFPAARAALRRLWGPRLAANTTFTRVVLPAAAVALVLATAGGVTAVAGGGTPDPGPAVPAPSGNVSQWIGEAEQVLAVNGWVATAEDTADLEIIIQGESGGNPNAVNRWDSNAQQGHPSQGLMQCIDSTFYAHALPGHTQILDPVDNIIAGVRYALGRYGSLDNVPGVVSVHAGGRYVGY